MVLSVTCITAALKLSHHVNRSSPACPTFVLCSHMPNREPAHIHVHRTEPAQACHQTYARPPQPCSSKAAATASTRDNRQEVGFCHRAGTIYPAHRTVLDRKQRDAPRHKHTTPLRYALQEGTNTGPLSPPELEQPPATPWPLPAPPSHANTKKKQGTSHAPGAAYE